MDLLPRVKLHYIGMSTVSIVRWMQYMSNQRIVIIVLPLFSTLSLNIVEIRFFEGSMHRVFHTRERTCE